MGECKSRPPNHTELVYFEIHVFYHYPYDIVLLCVIYNQTLGSGQTISNGLKIMTLLG